MNASRFLRLLSLALPCLVPLAGHGQVVSGDLFKTRYHDQTLSEVPANYFYRAEAVVFTYAANNYSAGSLARPAPLDPVALTQDAERWNYDEGFGSPAGLDTHFPDGGDYLFSLTGDTQPNVSWTLTLPSGGFWPDAVPAFTTGTRDALLAGPDPGSDLTFEFNSFTDETHLPDNRESLLYFRIFRQSDGLPVFELGAQPPGLGSATVPAATFSGGESYLAELIFSNRAGTEASSSAGFDLSYAAYDHLTQIQFTAVPEPDTAALVGGLMLVGWAVWRHRQATL